MNGQRPDARRYYRPELDVVRFVAFTLVFIYHTVPGAPEPRVQHLLRSFAPILYTSASACRFGLSLFFALSAFLICELLLREREASGTIAIKQFYVRRILRIWPLYYFAIGIGVAIAFLPGNHHGEIIQMGWFAIFMGTFYRLIPKGTATPMGQLWSISVEEQFYLFAPWVAKYASRRSLYSFCFLLVAVSNIWLWHLGRMSSSDLRIWTDPLVQFECFASGILLCLILHGKMPVLLLWQRFLLLIGASMSWYYGSYGLHLHFSIGSDTNGTWMLVGSYALGAFGSVLLLVAFMGIDPKFLPGWAVYLGRISYGLYIFHELSIFVTTRLIFGHLTSFASPIYLLKATLTLGLNVLMAALSYRYLELPFLKLKRRYEVIPSEPIQHPAGARVNRQPMLMAERS